MRTAHSALLVAVLTATVWCHPAAAPIVEVVTRPGEPTGFTAALSIAAIERTTHVVTYDGSYRPIPYPGGDVPDNVGVCTDVVVRIYRALGIDLQREDCLFDFPITGHYRYYGSFAERGR